MIRVLIVEDSAAVREFLTFILSSDPELQVVGVAKDGAEALVAVASEKPDVITMDINMPIMDGYESTRRIMESHPTPIVIVSGNLGSVEVNASFRALEAGALAVVPRPPGFHHHESDAAFKDLIRTVKLMSEVKVVKRLPRRTPRAASVPDLAFLLAKSDVRAVVIGASTGGPAALQVILSALPRDLPFPVLIVQHIATGFLLGFTAWLTSASNFPVRIATHGEALLPGFAYVAPDGLHMGVSSGPQIRLSDEELENGSRPSVAHLFRTSSEVFGSQLLGVLLTGMGKDGAKELGLMKERGALTVAQDKESSVIHGMPGEAIRLGAVTNVLSVDEIGPFIVAVGRKVKGSSP